MNSAPGPKAALSSLPSELLRAIAEPLSQTAKHALCLSCRRLRDEFEPLLYQDVTIRDVAASGRFHQTVTEDRSRAEWVRALSFQYGEEEDERDDYPDDMEVIPHLPNLERLALDTPYYYRTAWADVWARALDLNSPERILRNLKTCAFLFWDDNGEFWGSNVSKDFLWLPTLEHLTLMKMECDGIGPPPSGHTSSALPPLKTLIFAECDLHEKGLEEILQVRSAQAISVLTFDDNYPPIETGLHHMPEYVPALRLAGDHLEALQWSRYWELVEKAAPLGSLRGLRLLYIDPEILFGHAMGEGQYRDQWLKEVLPPNVETILFNFSIKLSDEATDVLVAMLQAKDTLMPKLQRIELLGLDQNDQQEIRPDLLSALKQANLQTAFFEKGYENRWAAWVAERHHNVDVDVDVGTIPPVGGPSIAQVFYTRRSPGEGNVSTHVWSE